MGTLGSPVIKNSLRYHRFGNKFVQKVLLKVGPIECV